MRLIVWILEPDPAAAAQLLAAWKSVASDSVDLHLFSVLPQPNRNAPPDLLMAETLHRCAEVTELLLALRSARSTDFLPVTSDASPSSFTRAQQLGAIDYILKPFTVRRLRQSLRRYLTLKRGLTAGSDLTQSQLDLFFFSGPGRNRLPALALPDSELLLCKKLLAFLARCQEHACTALQAAEALTVSRVTARKYLEILARSGCVQRLSVPGMAGRPKSVYQLKGDFI